MKALVIRAFTDKTNMADVYHEGDTFNGSAERIRELANAGYVEQVDEEKPTKRWAAKAKEV